MNDFDQFMKKYFGVFLLSQTYLNLIYLILSFPLGLFYFIFLVTGASIGFALAILVIGVLILAAVFAASWGMVSFERVLATSLLHVKIPPMEKPSASSDGFWVRVKDYLTNPVTWKGLLYLFCRFPLGIINFSLVVSFFAALLGMIAAPFIYQWATYDLGFLVVNSLSTALLVSLIGILLVPAALHLLNFMARIQGEFARVMLGQASYEEQSPAPASMQPINPIEAEQETPSPE
jgi:hypothetical protein